VHCFKPKGYSGVAAWILWNLRRLGLTRSRLVVDEDDWEGPGGWNDLEPYPPLLRATFAWQERWGLCHNDGITVASRTLQTLAWSLGVPPDRVCYLPNGAHDPQTGDGAAVRTRFGLEAGPIILLYTRFFEYDVARAIDVFRAVLAEIPGARLLVVGRGLFQRQDARFDQLVAQAGLADSVVRAGWVPEAELPGFFRAADVAIYPFDDTLVNRAKCAVKLVDLLAAGVAVVADAVGQNGEYIVPNGSGLLVPPGDVGAMASATVRLLRDAARRQALGQAAMQRIHEHFGWPRLASDLEAFYTQRLSRA
jgi:glycosyltransferase involved in cell wall biosynthesis